MITIGIDAGTSVVKSVAYTADGTELAVVRRPTRVHHPEPTWAEQDMDEVWTAVADTVAELAAGLDDPVRAIGITAQGDGCWLVDRAGRPTGPALLWNDARAGDIAAHWAGAGLLDQVRAMNGSVGFGGLAHAQLTWLAEHEPARVAAADHLLSCGSWLFHRLTGTTGWDVSEACNPFLDSRTGQYSTEILELLGLDWARRLLPDVLDGPDRVAALHPATADRVGLPAGTPVVLGSYDVVSTALGAGATEPGQACSILGTTLCTGTITDDPGAARTGMQLRTPMPGRWMLANATLAGTEVVDWACRALGSPGPGQLTELAGRAEPGSGGLLVLPYLSPGGERAPFYDPAARGSVHGLRLDHGPAEIARACLEGLAAVIHDCLHSSDARPTELRLTGGGSTSPLWRQIIADITGLPVVRTTDEQAGARGAALTALSVLDGHELTAVAAEVVDTATPVEPDPAHHERYADLVARFAAAREDARAAGWYRQTG
ncbi:carbohydrate kinase [Saccharopolyspora sp. HNM0983]|uniref:Carbohydrate kinase n=1 Tax=Saccharopolyspora montiporae TaxID=2781240 RepID=A0A929FXY9_9PSEU|nr:carbohydrate kinase [Saccharopolyspora sp. HNM0983]